jgi:DNA mismatch repair protein MutS
MPSVDFRSILNEEEPAARDGSVQAPECLADLNLDQVIDAIVGADDEYHLRPFFLSPLATTRAIEYRHEVMRDLESDRTFGYVTEFASTMRRVREELAKAAKVSPLQSQRLTLDAQRTYSQAVVAFGERLLNSSLNSRGLRAFGRYLSEYAASPAFRSRASAADAVLLELDNIGYAVHIKDNAVSVSRYGGQADYSDEVAETFDKFSQGQSASYVGPLRDSIDMSQVEERILSLVAKLFPTTFAKLAEFRERNQGFIDPTIARFDREIQFYVAYKAYVMRFVAGGLPICYPEVQAQAKTMFASDTFDAALADSLIARGAPVVLNDVALADGEQLIVVSGPNQGGKTTFARLFGQLHYLAGLGCPVPGRAARLALFDRILTHFEREEFVENLRSKLEDDLLRIRAILERATARSIIIVNEIFSSTTTSDAYFLAREIVEQVLVLGARCVCVTFLDALAATDDRIVSMVSMVSPDDPAIRTYKVARRPAGGRSYAASIAEKHRLTYASVRARIETAKQ